MADTASEDLPNPFTPMAFLPPDVAFHVTIKTYVVVGTAAVLVWDVLNNLRGDYQLLAKYPIRIPTLAYFLSRFSTLIYIINCAVFDTIPVNACAELALAMDWFFPVVISSTSLLFLLRARAVFNDNIYIVSLFFFTWFAVVGGSLTSGLGTEGGNIGTTKYCWYTSVKSYVSASFIIPLVHDTLIFIAISWRLMGNAHVDHNFKSGFRTLLLGHYLPAFSRAMLQDGQMYYLSSLTTGLLSVILLFIPAAPTYKILFTVPNVALTHIMACRVFRNTKFGRFREASISTMQLRFTAANDRTTGPGIPLSLARQARIRRRSDSNIQNITDREEKDIAIELSDGFSKDTPENQKSLE
ncbi:hypothetical protein BDZ97DRAFT_1767467 [Flammula alnicola]|nr:hypothetical protein BDZ97DRAFT_1767467 [Flammula alnicola]